MNLSQPLVGYEIEEEVCMAGSHITVEGGKDENPAPSLR